MKGAKGILLVATILTLAACGRSSRAESGALPPAESPTNLLAAQSLIPEPASNPGLQISSPPERTFEGYACTVDCSGHEAGWERAEDHSVTDESECGGNSESFREGCVAYAESGGTRRDEDDGDGL